MYPPLRLIQISSGRLLEILFFHSGIFSALVNVMTCSWELESRTHEPQVKNECHRMGIGRICASAFCSGHSISAWGDTGGAVCGGGGGEFMAAGYSADVGGGGGVYDPDDSGVCYQPAGPVVGGHLQPHICRPGHLGGGPVVRFVQTNGAAHAGTGVDRGIVGGSDSEQRPGGGYYQLERSGGRTFWISGPGNAGKAGQFYVGPRTAKRRVVSL